MDDSAFEDWLALQKTLGSKSRKDVVSRCKRVERLFDISLDAVVRSEEKTKELYRRLRTDVGRYMKPGSKQKPAWASLIHATRLYAEYKARR